MFGNIKVFSGTASPKLAHEIASYLNVPLSGRDIIKFPNENIFVKLHASVRGQDCYVVQTTSAPTSDNLLELLIMVQTLRLDSAGRITVVVPYLAYARSDKKDQPRVPITARLVADMIQVAGADRYILMDLHAGQIQGFFSIPGDVLTAFHIVSDYFAEIRPTLKDPVIVTADLGFAKKGRNFAARLNCTMAFVEKRRTGNDANAFALTVIGDVEGRDVIIVDEIIDTGLTLSWLTSNLGSRDPASVEICTLLRKPEALTMPVEVKYVGWDIPNEFVVGYGLDYRERYRNLRDIGTLAPHVYGG